MDAGTVARPPEGAGPVAIGLGYERAIEHASAIGEVQLEHVPPGLDIEADGEGVLKTLIEPIAQHMEVLGIEGEAFGDLHAARPAGMENALVLIRINITD